MLGKLMKYEFRDTSKLMFTTYGALALATFMGTLGFYQLNWQGVENSSGIATAIWLILLVIYIFAIIGIYIGDFIYLCHRYYKTMYSAQGYLTNTLPVSPASVLNAKMLTAYIWILLSTVLSVLSVFIMLSVGTGQNLFLWMFRLDWDEMWKSFYEATGMTPAFYIIAIGITLLVGLLYYILFVYASMAIGQLFNGSRTGYSILAGFCIYILQQLAGTAVMAGIGYSNFHLLSSNSSAVVKMMRNTIFSGICLSVITTVLLYLVCLYINKKKLNLE